MNRRHPDADGHRGAGAHDDGEKNRGPSPRHRDHADGAHADKHSLQLRPHDAADRRYECGAHSIPTTHAAPRRSSSGLSGCSGTCTFQWVIRDRQIMSLLTVVLSARYGSVYREHLQSQIACRQCKPALVSAVKAAQAAKNGETSQPTRLLLLSSI